MVGRNSKLQKLKERYPNMNKFPIRPEPMHMQKVPVVAGVSTMQLGKKGLPTQLAMLNKMWEAQYSNQRCRKCKTQLKYNMLNILATMIGVQNKLGEYFCPCCGERYRTMTQRDSVTAQKLRNGTYKRDQFKTFK